MSQVHDGLPRPWLHRSLTLRCINPVWCGARRLSPAVPMVLIGPLVLLVVQLLAACTPALDWRQFQPDGLPLVVAMPCKPSSQQRQLVLAGQTVLLRMLVCSADGHTFALASAELGDPLRVEPALQALGRAAQTNVQAHTVSEQPAAVPGMTPNPAARRWRLQGRLPDGAAVAEQVLVFAHGTRVFQASLIGAQADDARAAPFLDAIRVQP